MNYYRKTVGFLASSRIGRVMMLGIVAMVAFSSLADAANQRRGAKVKSIVVESAASSAKAITAFRFEGLTPSVTGTIDQTNHTVALTVPYGTTVTDLVSTFTVSDGATVKVGSTSQTSGTTANNFSSPKTYTVTAADGTTQAYTVTVKTSLAIGDAYGGGKIAYILAAGESIGYIDANGVAQVQAYDADVQHGLIAATGDQSAATTWSNITTVAIGTTAKGTAIGTAIGTGASNTLAIIAQTSHTASAAKICAEYTNADTGTGVYSDWYLPSKDELNQLYANRAAVGGFGAFGLYWSSSEYSAAKAWVQYFGDGSPGDHAKTSTYSVRPVRAF
ncbi:DUF1566 domain-containing protein [Chlorobium phaeovibrioides]|uniref:Lcl domain-containing protein n=1 Tax=Chlorobium phaeovibrioides TaxID=1094 RepID=UPI000F8235A6|nr:DUF1566 domain-containing protein [Chlorobium phaeovibrioides]RTY36676.1 DUF1566 domain-containing protein [Chlorobium phaeovibrioides]